MATLNYKILPARRKASGKLGIYLAVTHKKEVRYISTEFEIDDESQFEDGKVCYRKDAMIMNKRMAFVLSTYREKLSGLDLKGFDSCAKLKDKLLQQQEAKSMTLEELFDYKISKLKKERRESTSSVLVKIKKKILGILGNPFIEYLSLQDIILVDAKMKEMNHTAGGIQMHMSYFKALVNEAIKNKWVKYEDHPFSGYKVPKPGVRLIDVSAEEFQRIRDYKTVNKRTALARDMFLLSFYLGGINLADLVEVDLSGDELCYRRKKTINKKTADKQTCFRIPDEAKELIKVYAPNGKLLWPGKRKYDGALSYLSHCFMALKKEMGIKAAFSFYSGRKTFAQFAFMLGIRTEVIEYCVGQTVKDNRPIYNYVRVMQRQADMAIRKVIDYTIDPSSLNLYDVL